MHLEPTLKKTHNLLEKLADYVMSRLPTREEMDAKLGKKADKEDVQKLLEGQDKIVQELDIIRTEQSAFHAELNRLEERIEHHEKVGH